MTGSPFSGQNTGPEGCVVEMATMPMPTTVRAHVHSIAWQSSAPEGEGSVDGVIGISTEIHTGDDARRVRAKLQNRRAKLLRAATKTTSAPHLAPRSHLHKRAQSGV